MRRFFPKILLLLLCVLSFNASAFASVIVTASPDEQTVNVGGDTNFSILGTYSADSKPRVEHKPSQILWKYNTVTVYADEDCTVPAYNHGLYFDPLPYTDVWTVCDSSYSNVISLLATKPGTYWFKFQIGYLS